MVYKKHPLARPAVRRKVSIPTRPSVRLAPDVERLMKNSLRFVAWDSISHALNAGLRHAFKKFAHPHQQPIQIDPFDQVAFADLKLKHKTKPNRTHAHRR